MRKAVFGLLGLVCIIGAGCGKKAPPPTPDAVVATEAPPATTAAADVQAPAAEDTAVAAAEDTVAPAADDAAAPAADDAQAPVDDAVAATDDAAAPAADDAVAAAEDTAPAEAMPTFTAVAKPEHPFDDFKTDDEKKAYMKQFVIGPMRERFQWYDATKFEKVTCGTCHGPGAKEGKFEMPNADLTKLPSTPEGWKALGDKKPKALQFMKEVVMPAMATLVGEEPFDMATGKGFGCFECHTKE